MLTTGPLSLTCTKIDTMNSELYKYWRDNSGKNPCLGEAKMAENDIQQLWIS